MEEGQHLRTTPTHHTCRAPLYRFEKRNTQRFLENNARKRFTSIIATLKRWWVRGHNNSGLKMEKACGHTVEI